MILLKGYFAMYLAVGNADTAPHAVIVYYGVYALTEAEVAKLDAPVLILQGERDSIDFVANARRIEQLARRNDSSCELILYPGVGHQFDLFEPNGVASREAWGLTLEFFQRHLDNADK